MAITRIGIMLSLTLACFAMCNIDTQDENPMMPGNQKLASNVSIASPLSGLWYYQYSLYSISELTINNDSTFTFHEKGCIGHAYTEGKWTGNDQQITLKSFDKYRDDESQEATQPKTDALDKKSNEVVFDTAVLNNMNTIIGHRDTVQLYFDHITLKFEHDTLFPQQPGILTEGGKFYRLGRDLRTSLH